MFTVSDSRRGQFSRGGEDDDDENVSWETRKFPCGLQVKDWLLGVGHSLFVTSDPGVVFVTLRRVADVADTTDLETSGFVTPLYLLFRSDPLPCDPPLETQKFLLSY